MNFARFLIELPNLDNKVVYNEDQTITRKSLKQRFERLLPSYPIYNGFMMTRLLRRLTDNLEDKRCDIDDALRKKDQDEIGEVSLKAMHDVLRQVGINHLDEDLQDFLEYLLFR